LCFVQMEQRLSKRRKTKPTRIILQTKVNPFYNVIFDLKGITH